MRGLLVLCCLVAVSTADASAASGARKLLWEDPGVRTISDWIWGPGGEARAPRPPFQFVKENLGGTNPKIEVRDSKGALWIVKFGGEVHSAVFASRLLYATGYPAEPAYFVREGRVRGVHHLKRARRFIARDGSFHDAVFRLRDDAALAYADEFQWSWTANPFLGSHELSGLKILMMLASNWDAKDARDGDGSNTAVFRKKCDGGTVYVYAFTDWGASFGSWGGFLKRTKWDWAGYQRETGQFARLSSYEQIMWGYRGKHWQDLAAAITRDDVRWLLPYLSRISDEELRAGLIASGARIAVANLLAREIQARIAQLRRVTPGAAFQEVVK